MSRKPMKKFKKDRFDDEENEQYFSLPTKDKRKDRRINRALRTKDIESLLEDDEADDYLYEDE